MTDLKNIIESLLFVSAAPLSAEQIKELVPDAETREIRQTLAALEQEYRTRNGGFVLEAVAGGYQFRTRPEYRQWIEKLNQPQPAKLSRAALETLAIVAYHQPVLRSEIEHIRGVNSGNTLRYLMEKKLIRVLGRREIPGRPLVYGTTKRFLELFGLNSLQDLPAPEEINPGDDKNNP